MYVCVHMDVLMCVYVCMCMFELMMCICDTAYCFN